MSSRKYLRFFRNTLRVRQLSIPIIATLFMGVLTLLFITVLDSHKNLMNHILQFDVAKSESLIQLFSRVSANHLQIIDLLALAGKNKVDEEKLYVIGSLYMGRLHDFTTEIDGIFNDFEITEQEKSLYSQIQKNYDRYRELAFSTMTMATIELKTVNQYIPDTNSHFQKVSEDFLHIIAVNQINNRSFFVEFQKSSEKRLSQFYLILGIAIFCLVFFSWYLSQSILKPLLKLVRATEKVTKDVDYSIRVDKTNIDEINVLTEGFNMMLTHIEVRNEVLKKNEASLQAAKENLEQRVDENTSELKNVIEQLRHEIEERKEVDQKSQYLEGQLRQSQKMDALGTLAGGIVHDFNNMLLLILSNTEMLISNTVEGSKESMRLNMIMNAADRASDMAKQILDFSRRVDSTNIKVEKFPLVVIGALKMVRATLPTNIEIHQDIQEDCSNVLIDATQMHQIILNLCTNAFHAMEESGGTLFVSLKELNEWPHRFERADSCLELIVKDTGSGIPPELQDKIFDPFFTTKEIGKGTGLGLSIVHKIIEDQNGIIIVNSEPFIKTEFIIYLPTVTLEVADKTVEKIYLQQGNTHLLFVEDETSISATYKDYFQELGYDVTICNNGQEALDKFKDDSIHIDVVLTDQAMPAMTGKELSKNLLEIQPDLPIILLTGFSSVISEEEANSIGIRKFFNKPIRLSILQKAIEECFV